MACETLCRCTACTTPESNAHHQTWSLSDQRLIASSTKRHSRGQTSRHRTICHTIQADEEWKPAGNDGRTRSRYKEPRRENAWCDQAFRKPDTSRNILSARPQPPNKPDPSSIDHSSSAAHSRSSQPPFNCAATRQAAISPQQSPGRRSY